jgi:tetratricopeptide (TPR) repeat protein
VALALFCAALLFASGSAVASPGPTHVELLDRGRNARLKGDLVTARRIYEQALAQDPDNLRIALELAETLRAMGDPEAAENLLARFVRSFPDRPEPRQALVLAYLQSGKTSEALTQAKRAVDLDPENLDGHLCLGSALRAAGRPADAVPEFERGTRRSPPDPRALHGLALAYSELGDPRTEDTFQKAVEAAPKNLVARLDFVRYLWQVRNFERGNQEMDRILRIAPASSKLRVEYGANLTQQGRLPEAITQLKKAWADGDREYEAAFFLGVALGQRQVGRFEEAGRWLRQAIAIDPRRQEAHASLGQLFLVQQKPREAITEFELADSLQPDSAEIHLDLGSAYEAAKILDKAEGAYRKALQLDPTLAKAHYMLGTLLARIGRREEAAEQIAVYQTAFQKEQESAFHRGSRRAQLDLGWVELRSGSPQQALEQFERYPEDPDALRGAAWALVQLGRKDEALQKYERAIARTTPEDAGLRYELDREYARLRNK